MTPRQRRKNRDKEAHALKRAARTRKRNKDQEQCRKLQEERLADIAKAKLMSVKEAAKKTANRILDFNFFQKKVGKKTD